MEESGRLVATGAGDGSTSILELAEGLVSNSKLDRNKASDMFERWGAQWLKLKKTRAQV